MGRPIFLFFIFDVMGKYSLLVVSGQDHCVAWSWGRRKNVEVKRRNGMEKVGVGFGTTFVRVNCGDE